MQISHARRHSEPAERRLPQLIRNVASYAIHRRHDLIKGDQGFPIRRKRRLRADDSVRHPHGISFLAWGFHEPADRIADKSQNIGDSVSRRGKAYSRAAAEQLAKGRRRHSRRGAYLRLTSALRAGQRGVAVNQISDSAGIEKCADERILSKIIQLVNRDKNARNHTRRARRRRCACGTRSSRRW